MLSDYKTVLVTGASGLTGQALVERFCGEGLEVHALSRDSNALQNLKARTGCVPHAIDLADTAALTSLLSTLAIDVLINNAGVGAPGLLASNSAEQVDAQVDVNIRAVLHLARLIMPGMIERDRGHIVTIGSMAGHYHFPGNVAYHATKAAVHMFSRELRLELFGKRVRVTEISPGRIKTDMFAKANQITAEQANEMFFDGYEPLLPSDIADAVIYAVGTPSHVNISHIEILPTMQVTGGLRFAKSTP